MELWTFSRKCLFFKGDGKPPEVKNARLESFTLEQEFAYPSMFVIAMQAVDKLSFEGIAFVMSNDVREKVTTMEQVVKPKKTPNLAKVDKFRKELLVDILLALCGYEISYKITSSTYSLNTLLLLSSFFDSWGQGSFEGGRNVITRRKAKKGGNQDGARLKEHEDLRVNQMAEQLTMTFQGATLEANIPLFDSHQYYTTMQQLMQNPNEIGLNWAAREEESSKISNVTTDQCQQCQITAHIFNNQQLANTTKFFSKRSLKEQGEFVIVYKRNPLDSIPMSAANGSTVRVGYVEASHGEGGTKTLRQLQDEEDDSWGQESNAVGGIVMTLDGIIMMLDIWKVDARID